MLTSYLSDVSSAGETAAEFIELYEKLIAASHWKYYLTVSRACRLPPSPLRLTFRLPYGRRPLWELGWMGAQCGTLVGGVFNFLC